MKFRSLEFTTSDTQDTNTECLDHWTKHYFTSIFSLFFTYAEVL